MSTSSSQAKGLVKKYARRFFVQGNRLLSKGGNGAITPGLRILTYHRIAVNAGDPFSTTPVEFTRQMRILKELGVVTKLQNAIDQLADRKGGCASQIVLTFDDGTDDFISAAAPVLTDLGLPATIYVSAAKVGQPGYLNWEELRKLSQSGISVQSHGMDHVSLGRIDPEELWRQLADSRKIIEAEIGEQVASFSYPYGTIRDFSDEIKEVARAAGYENACSSINGVNDDATDKFALRRTKIEQEDGPLFHWILRGCIDSWAFIDRHLAVLQNRYS